MPIASTKPQIPRAHKPTLSMRKILGEAVDRLTKEWHQLAFRGDLPHLVLVYSRTPTPGAPLHAMKWMLEEQYDPRYPEWYRVAIRRPHIESDEYMAYAISEGLGICPILNTAEYEFTR